jgi:hypothetical protein
MNPRYRRLLIPGLLIALLVIVLVSSLSRRAEGAEARPEVVSTLTDPRIEESSGLVVSPDDPDLAFTINDSGSDPVVYAVDVPSGETVGTATVDADLEDTEALSIDGDGTLWIADTGDNDRERTDVALYSLPAFGRADQGAVRPTRYPLDYPQGPRDVEALAVDPRTGAKFLLTKGLLGGEVYALPDELVADEPNEVTALDPSVPGVITDAAFATDGRHVVARDYGSAYVLDATTWQTVSSTRLPKVEQGETLAAEPDGRSYLAGSEGQDSPLIRVAIPTPSSTPSTPAATDPTPAPAASPVPAAPAAANGNGFAGATWFWAVVVVALLAAISGAATHNRR